MCPTPKSNAVKMIVLFVQLRLFIMQARPLAKCAHVPQTFGHDVAHNMQQLYRRAVRQILEAVRESLTLTLPLCKTNVSTASFTGMIAALRGQPKKSLIISHRILHPYGTNIRRQRPHSHDQISHGRKAPSEKAKSYSRTHEKEIFQITSIPEVFDSARAADCKQKQAHVSAR